MMKLGNPWNVCVAVQRIARQEGGVAIEEETSGDSIARSYCTSHSDQKACPTTSQAKSAEMQ